ncbi:MAG: ATP-binding protein [Chloroflexota bacterium]
MNQNIHQKISDEHVPPFTRSTVDLPLIRQAANAAGCGITIADYQQPDMPIIYANQAFTQITGYSVDEMMGKNCRFLQGQDQDQSGLATLRQAIREGKECTVLLRNYRKDGTLFWNELYLAPIYQETEPAAKQLTHFIGIQNDVTKRVTLTQERKDLMAHLQKVNRELNDFAYIISHDLKAPLRSIRMLSTWLKDDYKENLDAEGHELFDLLIHNVEKAGLLIDGVLDYSRIGRHRNPAQAIEISTLLDEIVHLFPPSSETIISIVPNMPSIKGDPVRISQLFQNLIDNAVRYMDKPNGEITIGFMPKDSEGKTTSTHWHFFVQDNGPGIEEKYFKKIFQIFQTLQPNASDDSSDSTSDNISTGVGLTIAQKIVALYDGEIWVESIIGKGSTFHFTLHKEGEQVGDLFAQLSEEMKSEQ